MKLEKREVPFSRGKRGFLRVVFAGGVSGGDERRSFLSRIRCGLLCLFRRYRADGRLRLGPGIPLIHKSGTPLTPKNPEVCDWDSDGDWDVIGQAGEFGKGGPAFFENRGGNETPEFREPVRLKCQGKEITLSAHEHSFAAVDWYGTGQLDLVCGAESGWFFFFRRSALDAPGPVEAHVVDRVEARS